MTADEQPRRRGPTRVLGSPRRAALASLSVVLVAALVWLLFGRRLTRHVRELLDEPELAGLAKRLFPLYLALLLIVQLMPFDLIVSQKVRLQEVRYVPDDRVGG